MGGSLFDRATTEKIMTDKIGYETGIGSNALKDPQRVVFITRKTSARVKGDVGKRLLSYPNLIVRGAIAFELLAIVLVALALLWDAPLEQLANPLLTPNPAKAPWYFLGLQELLHYFPPVVAGIMIPTLVVVGLVVIPYFNVNIKGEALWAVKPVRRFLVFLSILAALLIFCGIFEAWSVIVPTVAVAILVLVSYFVPAGGPRLTQFLRTRPLAWWVMTWFIAVSVTLTVVGTFFRGPGWSWVWPWR